MNEDYSNNDGGKNGDTDSDVTAALNNNNNNGIGYLVIKQYRNNSRVREVFATFRLYHHQKYYRIIKLLYEYIIETRRIHILGCEIIRSHAYPFLHLLGWTLVQN